MRGLGRIATYLALSLAAFLSVFPFYWMVVGTTNSSADIIQGKADFGGALQANVTRFFTQVDVPRVFFNSFKIALLGTLATLAVASLAGYGFEVFRSRGKALVAWRK